MSGQTVKIARIVSKAEMTEGGGYFMSAIRADDFKVLVEQMAEEDVVVPTKYHAAALKALTGRDPSMGTRSMKLAAGEAALVFDLDYTDAISRSDDVVAMQGTLDNIKWIIDHCRLWLVIKVDVEQILSKIAPDMSVGQLLKVAEESMTPKTA